MIKLESFASISDLHIESIGDYAYRVFEGFVAEVYKYNVSTVVLLGDIFDVFSGNHSEYYKKLSQFFSHIEQLLRNGFSVYYFEGNHDLHLMDLLKTRFAKYFNSSFFYVKKYIVVECFGYKVLLDHGDNIEPGTFNYSLYKKFISSEIMRVIVDKYLSYDQIIRIGTKASSSSSRYSRIIDENQVRDKFRNAAVNKIKTSIDKVIMGHSHVCDDFKVNRMDKEIHYLNNGYPPKSGKYILAHDGEISLQAITIE